MNDFLNAIFGGGAQPQQGGVGQMNYMMTGNTGGVTPTTTTPQWQKGVQLGQQMAQMGLGMAQQAQRPMPAPMAPRPMMGGMPPPQGVPQAAVPGMQGMAPPVPGGMQVGVPPWMNNGGMGMGMGTNMGQGQPMGAQPGGINPQLLSMLMRARG